jgi:hypothetical protein
LVTHIVYTSMECESFETGMRVTSRPFQPKKTEVGV